MDQSQPQDKDNAALRADPVGAYLAGEPVTPAKSAGRVALHSNRGVQPPPPPQYVAVVMGLGVAVAFVLLIISFFVWGSSISAKEMFGPYEWSDAERFKDRLKGLAVIVMWVAYLALFITALVEAIRRENESPPPSPVQPDTPHTGDPTE